MQAKESILVVQRKLKILSLGITVGHHSASLMMPNSYPRDGIFNSHLTTIKDPYNLQCSGVKCLVVILKSLPGLQHSADYILWSFGVNKLICNCFK